MFMAGSYTIDGTVAAQHWGRGVRYLTMLRDAHARQGDADGHRKPERGRCPPRSHGGACTWRQSMAEKTARPSSAPSFTSF